MFTADLASLFRSLIERSGIKVPESLSYLFYSEVFGSGSLMNDVSLVRHRLRYRHISATVLHRSRVCALPLHYRTLTLCAALRTLNNLTRLLVPAFGKKLFSISLATHSNVWTVLNFVCSIVALTWSLTTSPVITQTHSQGQSPSELNTLRRMRSSPSRTLELASHQAVRFLVSFTCPRLSTHDSRLLHQINKRYSIGSIEFR